MDIIGASLQKTQQNLESEKKIKNWRNSVFQHKKEILSLDIYK